MVLEAAAYDVVLVETVGVGQSEITVAGMVDTFLFLTLARTGDQLQGIKKGILEIADVIAVNKADGDRAAEATAAARELAGALRLVHGRHGEGWAPPVLTCSGLRGRRRRRASGSRCSRTASTSATTGLADKRARPALDFTWALVRDELDQRLRRSAGVAAIREPRCARPCSISDAVPALLAGNAVVVKPDSQTPYCTLANAELLYQAGVPREVFAVIPGPGSVVGTAIVEQCDYLMFTGSTATGRTLAEQCGRRLIGFSAELGGKNLGEMYANGRGVPLDDVKAVAWFRKAADQGLATAQADLVLHVLEWSRRFAKRSTGRDMVSQSR